MRRHIASLTYVLISLSLTSCLQLNSFNHQPALARNKAEQSADAAFIEHYLVAAYGFLSQALRNQLPFEQFKDVVAKMHPAQYPDAVNATEYEPPDRPKGCEHLSLWTNSQREILLSLFHGRH